MGQEFSTGEGWEERVRGVSEARQLLKECGRMYGIRFRERDRVEGDSWSPSGEKIADGARKGP